VPNQKQTLGPTLASLVVDVFTALPAGAGAAARARFDLCDTDIAGVSAGRTGAASAAMGQAGIAVGSARVASSGQSAAMACNAANGTGVGATAAAEGRGDATSDGLARALLTDALPGDHEQNGDFIEQGDYAGRGDGGAYGYDEGGSGFDAATGGGGKYVGVNPYTSDWQAGAGGFGVGLGFQPQAASIVPKALTAGAGARRAKGKAAPAAGAARGAALRDLSPNARFADSGADRRGKATTAAGLAGGPAAAGGKKGWAAMPDWLKRKIQAKRAGGGAGGGGAGGGPAHLL
jgi:hypothetical protein